MTFCVVDLETTGGSPADSAITEVGAVKVQRGEVVGTFQTLVDPGQPVPAFIRLLTGIDDEVSPRRPPIDSVLPSLLEFVAGHGPGRPQRTLRRLVLERGAARTRLRAASEPGRRHRCAGAQDPRRRGAESPAGDPGRRISGVPHQPCHRAFADVLATIDVLHHLIERVAGFGVVTLEDLLALSASRIDGTFSKISLAEGLPRGCGVYRFVGATGNTLYVGKATNVRHASARTSTAIRAARSRICCARRRRSRSRHMHRLLEAEVAEARAIQTRAAPLQPRREALGDLVPQGHRRAGHRGKIAPAALAEGRRRSLSRSVPLGQGRPDAHRRLARCRHRSIDVRNRLTCNGCAFSEMRRGATVRAPRIISTRCTSDHRRTPERPPALSRRARGTHAQAVARARPFRGGRRGPTNAAHAAGTNPRARRSRIDALVDAGEIIVRHRRSSARDHETRSSRPPEMLDDDIELTIERLEAGRR